MDLMPRWIHPHLFVFLCPHCQGVFLTCKNAVMSRHEQCEVTENDAIGLHGVTVVLCDPEMAWNYPSGADFNTISVTPSLDASASGHWHGTIESGAIKP